MARYLVNSGGVVHSVNDDDFQTHMAQLVRPPSDDLPNGYQPREATEAEIVAHYRKQGIEYDHQKRTARRLSDGAVWDDGAEEWSMPEPKKSAAKE